MDREEFAACVTPHITEMARVAAALVGSDAEDAAQESLERAWAAQDQLRDPRAVRAWLLRITINVCRNWWKGRYGTRHLWRAELTEAQLPAIAICDPGSSDATAALDLRQAIGELAEMDRVIVVLRYYVGLDATEIGAAVGQPSATIRTRLRRALERLRSKLDGAPMTEKGAEHVK